jgi:hypothetical protein
LAFRKLRLSVYKPKAKESTWYKCISDTLKVLLNAGYGVFGSNKISDFPQLANDTSIISKEYDANDPSKTKEA